MTDAELIEETNRLLHTILQNDAEQKARSSEVFDKMKERREASEAKMNERRKERLREAGLPEEATKGSEEDWEARQREARRKSRENIDASRQRHERYQEELLTELRTQSDLLRQIAERLAQ